jgi:hypothetical protein
VRLQFVIGILAMLTFAASSAMADVDTITYTDFNSDTVSLVMTGTQDVNGGLDVTDITGTFNGSAVSGPLTGTVFGTTSGEFYANPGVLPPNTVDTGVVFQAPGASALVQFYQYNYFGNTGFATALVFGGNYLNSGEATVATLSVSTPEPSSISWVLLAFGVPACFLALRKRRKSNLQQVS